MFSFSEILVGCSSSSVCPVFNAVFFSTVSVLQWCVPCHSVDSCGVFVAYLFVLCLVLFHGPGRQSFGGFLVVPGTSFAVLVLVQVVIRLVEFLVLNGSKMNKLND